MQDVRLHFHIAPARSLYRTWTDKAGDDLSSFRHTVNEVISTGKPIRGIELGKGGMVIRGGHPIKTQKGTAGSDEIANQQQNLNRVVDSSLEAVSIMEELENRTGTLSDDIRNSMLQLVQTVELLSINAGEMKEEIKRFKL